MPIQVTCPSCQTTLKTADSSAGKRAKCPQCGGVLEIPMPVAVVLEDDEYELEAVTPTSASLASNELGGATPATETDRRPCPACGEMIARKAIKCRFCNEVFDRSLRGLATGSGDVNNPGWEKVRSGLGTLYYCIVAILVSVVLLVIGGIVVGAMQAASGSKEPPVIAAIGMILFGITCLVAGIGTIVGQIRCTNVPAESGAKGFANGAAACIVLNIVLSIAGAGMQTPALSGLGSLLSVVGYILFILFIRRAASYLGDADLATSAGRFLIFGVFTFFGMIGAIAAAAAQIELLSLMLGVTLFVMCIAAFIWYLRLIKSLMTTIDLRMSAR